MYKDIHISDILWHESHEWDISPLQVVTAAIAGPGLLRWRNWWAAGPCSSVFWWMPFWILPFWWRCHSGGTDSMVVGKVSSDSNWRHSMKAATFKNYFSLDARYIIISIYVWQVCNFKFDNIFHWNNWNFKYMLHEVFVMFFWFAKSPCRCCKPQWISMLPLL